MNDLLTGKNAIIYGGGGSIGGATARTFAREGATVFLAGRTRETLQQVADDITASGARAEVAVVDATDGQAVNDHADAVVAKAGSIDISFNLALRGDSQGTPLVDMTVDDYMHALTVGAKTTFLTTRAAARHMIAGDGGVILHLTSASSRGTQPGMGNTGPTDAAVEAFLRYLAAETGPQGVRVAGIHTAGVRDTLTPEKIGSVNPDMPVDIAAIQAAIGQMAMLKRAPDLDRIAETATFLASDRAGCITSTFVNATCGLVAG